MSIISLKKNGSGTGAVLVSDIKERVHGSTMYSAESAGVIDAIKNANFESVDIGGMAEQLRPVLEGGVNTAAPKNPNGLACAAMIMAIGSRPVDYLTMFTAESKMSSVPGTAVALADGMEFDSVYSAESFDNQNLTDNLAISIGLNYKIARQGPAMEMVYRTIPLTPEQGGIDIEVPNLYVQNTLRHSEDGSESDFGLRRVIDSHIDYQVLNDNSTKLLPTYNATSAANFVANSVVTPYQEVDGRRTVTTSALLTGKTINLLGLGQIDAVSRVGQANYTDALDRNIGVAKVFMTLGADTLMWDTKGLPFSRFVKTPEQNNRGMKLDFPLTSLTIDGTSLRYDNTALVDPVFTTIKNGGYRVRLKTIVNGSADVERGTVSINPGNVEVMSIIVVATGEVIALTSTIGQSIVDGLANLKIEGWWPDARLTNTNHRHLGLMLNVRAVRERLLTRVRSPFFVPYPISEERDQTVMDWLTFAVGAYINNEGVGTLINYHERLMRLTGGLRGELTVGDFEINAIPMEGVGRYLINPYIQTVSVDLLANSQSLQTVDNIKNGQEVLINTLRSVSFDIIQRTNYENACRYMDGGEITKKWKIALVTSPKIERFMTVSGDSRTLGADLPFQLESDVDARLNNTMYMTIVREGEGIDPLSGGIMLLTPTLVANINVTRDNTPRNEAVVQPRFQHYNLLPIIVKLEISGVDQLLEQSIPFHVQTTAAA